MRQPFAHEATLGMDADADVNAIGAAVTQAVCGHWEHEPPCPLAPHHSQVPRLEDGAVYLRVLFATEPDMEGEVRRRITAALLHGKPHGTGGSHVTWRLRSSHASSVTDGETDHAQRLVRS